MISRPNERGSKPAWLVLLVLPILTSCFAAHERRLARDLVADGDLEGAHRILESLVSEGETQDEDALLEVRRQIAAHHFRQATEWRRRGHDQEAFQQLSRALLRHPQHAPARHLALTVGDEQDVLRHWTERYRAAVDSGDAEGALDLLVEAERDGLDQRHYGVVDQLVARAWQKYAVSFEEARIARRLADMQLHVAAAGAFLNRHETFVLPVALSLSDELDGWRAVLRIQEHLEARVAAAERAHDAGEATLALRQIRQAYLLDPECPWLHRRLQELQAQAVEAWLEQLKQASAAGEWQDALALWRRLEALGVAPESAELQSRLSAAGELLSLPALQELRAQELVASAIRLEQMGRVSDALLALIQAVQLNPALASSEAQATIVRLRSELRARPLVAVGEIAPERTVAPILVQRGSASFEERRLPRLKQRSDLLLPGALQERPNPSYEAERSRLISLQQQYDDAHRKFTNAEEMDQGFLASRCAHMQQSIERMQVRLEEMAPTEQRLSWQSSTWETETWELVAELDLPIELHRIDHGWSLQSVKAQLRVLDQKRAPDLSRGVPEDPDELPASAVVRQRLEAECQERFEELLSSLRDEARLLLCQRAQRRITAGEPSEAVDDLVWVILSSPSLQDPIRARAARLLVQANCPGSVVRGL